MAVGDFTVEDESLQIPCNAGFALAPLGFDYPAIGLDAIVRALERLDLTDKEKAKISSGNACKLFGR